MKEKFLNTSLLRGMVLLVVMISEQTLAGEFEIPRNRLRFVEEIVCSATAPTDVSSKGIDRVQTILGQKARVIPNT
ncbi:MAG: hypothetical protein D6820_14295, partial [Lentisphaerae bacterium]